MCLLLRPVGASTSFPREAAFCAQSLQAPEMPPGAGEAGGLWRALRLPEGPAGRCLPREDAVHVKTLLPGGALASQSQS